MLNLTGIKKDYITASETVHALKGVSISFRKTEFVSILGPSGCGKTTLLNIIGGLDHYTDGDMMIGPRSTKSYGDRDWDVYRNHRIGFIFQSYNLIPHQTVLGNVELALTIAGISKEERTERAKEALDRVGLKGQYHKRPNQLSGGQCQRVAIARALVNNPEILLADEPTGALDTVTSVQIMDLIKEISRERLVIMVTHNPELAEQYSTRIVRLLDGEIIEDTNPMSEDELACEQAEYTAEEEREKKELEALAVPERKQKIKENKKKREKAKMSFWTAFRLSARNLWSKRGRTTMVGFAGSIGIIGIAIVLAFSSGIKGYIASMQDDMLSGNPITITETAYDLEALTGMMDMSEKAELLEKLDGKVYISSVVEYLAEKGDQAEEALMKNEITREYIDYIKAMPKEYYNAMILDYGIDLSLNLFTEFEHLPLDESDTDNTQNVSIKNIIDIYTCVLGKTEFAEYASSIPSLIPKFTQAPSETDYILEQYDVAYGKVAEGKNEIMLVLNSEDELSDLLLAMMGYYTQSEFQEIIKKAAGETYDQSLYKQYFDYEELVGKTFTWYPNNVVFERDLEEALGFKYNYTTDNFNSSIDQSDKVEMEVVGILTPKENVNYGSLQSGVYYTEELTDHILSVNKNSEIVNRVSTLKGSSYSIPYRFEFCYTPIDADEDSPNKTEIAESKAGITASAMDMILSMIPGASESTGSDMEQRLIRSLGGNDLANSVKIYPLSFEEKGYVTEYLDRWNSDGTLTYTDPETGAEMTVAERSKITYTDALELIISIINTMIDIVSYALIAFTSVSLVVSTVMIGIITYVSVVERIKEIGVIRSLGGRKKDVSHLFNAETFIIGSLAGLFGILVTYLVSGILNLILKPLINYSSIASLPLSQALILILLSIGLTLISGLIPASSAAKKDPVVALRTE